MPNPFHYRAVIDRLARCADAPNPPHVQVAAACALARELTPGTTRARIAQDMLGVASPVEYARHKLRDLYDRAAPLIVLPVDAAGPIVDPEEEAAEDDADPL